MNDAQTGTTTLISQFRAIAKLMVDELTLRLRAAGDTHCTPAHHPVFEAIDPSGTRLTTLAARTGMTHQSMGELVRTMVDIGYVERVPDPSDGRATLVRLTPDGKRLVRIAITEIADIERQWLARFHSAGAGDVDLRGVLATALRQR